MSGLSDIHLTLLNTARLGVDCITFVADYFGSAQGKSMVGCGKGLGQQTKLSKGGWRGFSLVSRVFLLPARTETLRMRLEEVKESFCWREVFSLFMPSVELLLVLFFCFSTCFNLIFIYHFHLFIPPIPS